MSMTVSRGVLPRREEGMQLGEEHEYLRQRERRLLRIRELFDEKIYTEYYEKMKARYDAIDWDDSDPEWRQEQLRRFYSHERMLQEQLIRDAIEDPEIASEFSRIFKVSSGSYYFELPDGGAMRHKLGVSDSLIDPANEITEEHPDNGKLDTAYKRLYRLIQPTSCMVFVSESDREHILQLISDDEVVGTEIPVVDFGPGSIPLELGVNNQNVIIERKEGSATVRGAHVMGEVYEKARVIPHISSGEVEEIFQE